jgi:hypothetical protein
MSAADQKAKLGLVASTAAEVWRTSPALK